MSATYIQTHPSPAAIKEIRNLAVTIKSAQCALMLWQQVLNQEERNRLDGDLESIYCRLSTAGIWKKLRGVSTERAVVDVAFELSLLSPQNRRWLLRELGEIHDDPNEAIDAAVATGALVVVERPRSVYWQEEQVAFDWDKRCALWEFFWLLCRRAKAGQPIDRDDLGESDDLGTVAKKKYRLLADREFPTALGDRIIVVGRGTQQLDLPPEDIRICEWDLAGNLKEVVA